MKKFFLMLAGAVVLAGTLAATPEPAQAREGYGRWCGMVKKGRYVWRHGHREWVVHKFWHCQLNR